MKIKVILCLPNQLAHGPSLHEVMPVFADQATLFVIIQWDKGHKVCIS